MGGGVLWRMARASAAFAIVGAMKVGLACAEEGAVANFAFSYYRVS